MRGAEIEGCCGSGAGVAGSCRSGCGSAPGGRRGTERAWGSVGGPGSRRGAVGLCGCSWTSGGLWVLQRFCRTVSDPALPVQLPGGPQPRARRLAALLNRSLRVRMSDGRTLVGAFLCTDRDANIILGSAQEFLKAADAFRAASRVCWAWPWCLGTTLCPSRWSATLLPPCAPDGPTVGWSPECCASLVCPNW
uniref:Sm domain-containing protein n=1 Tax=Meleagris gallopavo TaxID=9103 RepID=G3URJ6_MELGA